MDTHSLDSSNVTYSLTFKALQKLVQSSQSESDVIINKVLMEDIKKSIER
jgi:hypothetical protein